MREVKLFPTTTGQSWLEMSSYKDHSFKSPADMSDKYDYIIVGAGYGGYGTASRLAELNPDSKIAVIEAIKIGDNDSGKNAGFIIDVPHDFGDAGGSSFEDNKMYFKLNTKIIARMRDTIKSSGIDVDWRDSGKYVCCCNPRSYKMIDTEVHDLDKMGVPYKIYEGEELNRRLGTEYYTKALYTSGSTLVNPADVLRGLFTTLPDNVEVFENCPVLRVDEGSNMVVVLQNGRAITGGNVIVTGGPFIEQFGIVKNVFCPVTSFGAFSRKLTANELKDFEGVEPWGCTAGHPAGTTVRYTADQRIYVRNGFSFNSQLTTSHQRIHQSIPKLRKAFENRFPNLRHVNFEFVYGGMINMTMNYRPLMMQKSSNLFASACGEGAGVAKTCLMGHYIAEWISGVQSEDLNFLRRIAKPSWLPPDPFRTAGARVRLAWEEYNAKQEI
ncbi:Glycine/D-amino acid oxidase [Maridesulfovibrio ferrireducens]|uniref:Glycine/D-amino acid oxidase n=1 Tax=Maridesulfovibrio ferrireducens TaxID=246191 RepID=A0A1G9EYA2_9BACT|nr:FAD-binding oxidoreductase [Maridesulfovibrio ferrireducens]SDK81091.1 Glycine/D-amino acid oxidase [Maridesulfovibrio ferrireducens]